MSDIEIKVVAVVIAGIFSFIGSFLGVHLTRRTEYDKWLRQQQSIVFSDCFRAIDTQCRKADDILYSGPRDKKDLKREIAINQVLHELKIPENLVRLYLPNEMRDKFSSFMEKIWEAYSPNLEQSRRLDLLDEANLGIMGIFEEAIKKY